MPRFLEGDALKFMSAAQGRQLQQGQSDFGKHLKGKPQQNSKVLRTGAWGGDTHQYPVIKLDSCGILKDILQHGGEREEIVWDPAVPHFGEGVVNQASIQSCHKGTCNSRAE